MEGGEGWVRSAPGDAWQVMRAREEGGRVERRHRGIVSLAVSGAWLLLLPGVAGMDNMLETATF